MNSKQTEIKRFHGKDSMGKGRVISFLSFWNSICFKIPQNFIWSFLANIVKLLFYGIQIKHFYPKWQYAFIKFLIGGVSTPMLATTILAMRANEQPNTKTAKVPTETAAIAEPSIVEAQFEAQSAPILSTVTIEVENELNLFLEEDSCMQEALGECDSACCRC